MTLGERIKKLRKEMGLSLGKLSEVSGISNAYLCQLETGKSKDPSLSKARQLASALNTTISYLFDGTEVKEFCGNCRFFGDKSVDYYNGEFRDCYRYPPQVLLQSDNTEIMRSPVVHEASDWCGEWKPKVDA